MHRALHTSLWLAVLVSWGFAAPADEAVWNDAIAKAKGPEVTILRDTWGVPHIFGKTDADAAFGLAYAHAEDDYPTIEDTLILTRALSASVKGMEMAPIDFMVHLLGVWDTVNAKYESDLSAEVRAICEAYAEGINYYAALHRDEVTLPDMYPVSGKDLVAGFVFRTPFFFGLDSTVRELFGDERRRAVSTKVASAFDMDKLFAKAGDYLADGLPMGSNTFSVGPARSSDGSTYLNVNAHQPWEGPVTWYEAHVHSEEGWDVVGGTFPGVPLILHGHNRHLGWAHTVNKPDLGDVYVLTINPENPDQYLFDGEWLDFDIKKVALNVRVSPDSKGTLKVRREVVRSVHGPVLRQKHGVYAIRYAGMNEVRQVEQWFRMNKATTMDEWLDAMRMQAIVSFNCGYADEKGNILYVYNARLPKRTPGYDYDLYLPGDVSETLWDSFLPFDDLPMVINPASGFVQNCNSSPFQTTIGSDNPRPENFSPADGIETHMTNRGLRALEVLGADPSITLDEFIEYKYDMAYSRESFMGHMLDAILEAPEPDDPILKECVALLRDWDRKTNPKNKAVAIAVMTALPHSNKEGVAPPAEALFATMKNAANALIAVHGTVAVEWEKVNRLRRGKTDLGIGGGPDILHAVYGRLAEDKAHYIGRTGDSYVLIVRWDKEGKLSSQSIHQFGSATVRENSPHYDDQSPLFVERRLKPVWFNEADIRANLEREYRPGE